MTDQPEAGTAGGGIPLHEFYFSAEPLRNDERENKIRENQTEILKRIAGIETHGSRLEHQLETLDIIFHYSALKGCLYGSDYLKDAFTAQNLFRKSVSELNRKEKS